MRTQAAGQPSGGPHIRSASVHPYRLVLQRPWRTRHGTRQRREGWLLRIDTEDGCTGWGDCAPLPEAGTETPAEAESVLRAAAEELSGQPQPMLPPLGEQWAGKPAARCAMETALLDLSARRVGQPLARHLNPSARVAVEANAVLGAIDQDLNDRALSAAAAGFSVLKVKVGISQPREELARLRLLARGLPPNVRLRLDANGAWGFEDAAWWLSKLADLPVECVEEPLARARCPALAELQRRAPCPIALDESLHRLGLEEVLAARAVRRLVLKPTALGGPVATVATAKRAYEAGLECVVTTTLESAIGVAAAAHVAAAIDGGLAHGLATADWLATDVARRLAGGALLRLPEAPGLGVAPDGV